MAAAMREYKVYAIVEDGVPIYIGATGRTMAERLKDYRNSKSSSPIHEYIREKWPNVEWSVLCICETEEEMYLKEFQYIDEFGCFYPAGLNVKPGGKHTGGYRITKPRSEEWRKNLSKRAKLRTGEKNPFYGKSHTLETKKKIAKARTGQPNTACSKPIVDEFGNTYPSLTAAAKAAGWGTSNFCTYLKRGKPIKGVRYYYV